MLNDHYNPEIEIYRGLWLLSWFVKEFGTADAIDAKEKGMAPEALLDERIRDLPAGSDGLLLQPYWTAGILHPDSLGAVIGFSDYHTRYHFYRAIIEGLCLELYMALRIMEDRSGLTIHEIRIGGGGAKSDVVCQIAADVFGLPGRALADARGVLHRFVHGRVRGQGRVRRFRRGGQSHGPRQGYVPAKRAESRGI